jgi:uncharacterized protein (TIGR03067 family)
MEEGDMKHMMISLVLALVASLPAQTGIKKEFQPLQGGWSLVTAEGQAVPPGSSSLMFIGDKYEGLSSGKVDERGAVKLDPSTKPMGLDFVITEGTSAGKTQLGLIEITGDTMTLILAEPGVKTRPSPGSSEGKLILKKIQ